MIAKLASQRGRQNYTKRAATIEPIFGRIKYNGQIRSLARGTFYIIDHAITPQRATRLKTAPATPDTIDTNTKRSRRTLRKDPSRGFARPQTVATAGLGTDRKSHAVPYDLRFDESVSIDPRTQYGSCPHR
jgi:hypothetical protein